MSRDRPFKDHQLETLHLLRDSPNVGEVAKRHIEVELHTRHQLEALENGQGLQGPQEPAGKAPASGTRPEDRMNKTEARYGRKLNADPSVRRWWFEHFKVRAGVERDWYTVDFMVERTNGELELHEVKGGHVREDAIEKFKAAALLYPMWRWIMRQQSGKGEPWETLYEYDPKIPTTEEDDDAE